MAPASSGAGKLVSSGFVRDKLMLLQGGARKQAASGAATALKNDLEHEVEAELGAFDWSPSSERSDVANRRSEARIERLYGRGLPGMQ